MDQLNELYLAYFVSFSIVIGKTLPFLIEAVIRWLSLEGKTIKSVTSWVVPVLVMYAGWGLGHLFEGSFLTGLEAWQPLAYAAWAALMANIEWKTVPWLKNAVNSLFDWLLDGDKKK